MDRRAFLKSSVRAAAFSAGGLLSPVLWHSHANAADVAPLDIAATDDFQPLARVFAQRAAALSAGRIALQSTRTQAHVHTLRDQLTLGTLHAATDLHPGFAYFAGLPGAIGMAARDADKWRTTDVRMLWHHLQQEAGIVCLAAGYTPRGDVVWSRDPVVATEFLTGNRALCAGYCRDVFRGLGVDAVDYEAEMGDEILHSLRADQIPEGTRPLEHKFRFRTFSFIVRVSSPVMVTVPLAAWNRLPPKAREALQLAASSLLQDAPPPLDPPRATRPYPELANTIDRIAEAIVADNARHDRLTRQIDAAYFAARRWHSPASTSAAV